MAVEFHSSKRMQAYRLAYFGSHAFEYTRWRVQPMRRRRLRARRPREALRPPVAWIVCASRLQSSQALASSSDSTTFINDYLITRAEADAVSKARTGRHFQTAEEFSADSICTERRELPPRQGPRRHGRQRDTQGHRRRGGGHKGSLWC